MFLFFVCLSYCYVSNLSADVLLKDCCRTKQAHVKVGLSLAAHVNLSPKQEVVWSELSSVW